MLLPDVISQLFPTGSKPAPQWQWQGRGGNKNQNLENMDNELTQIKTDGLQQAEAFLKDFLAVPPPEEEVQVNKFANNAKYLPISYVENKLDELFFGAWEVTDFHCQVIANEIVGWLQLRVFHPVLKTWLSRAGNASVQIQMYAKDKGGDGDITNVRNKIVNTLVKDFPHLKSECIKNAARSLGKAFGRDLNRKEIDNYEPFTEQLAFEETKEELRKMLNNCNNKEDLSILWDGLEPEQQQDVRVKKLFTARKAKIMTL
jgi:hypothetical protein